MSRHVGEMFRRVETGCAILLLTAIVALVSIASIARAVGSPISWSVEIAQLCYIWLCMLSADLALQSERLLASLFCRTRWTLAKDACWSWA